MKEKRFRIYDAAERIGIVGIGPASVANRVRNERGDREGPPWDPLRTPLTTSDRRREVAACAAAVERDRDSTDGRFSTRKRRVPARTRSSHPAAHVGMRGVQSRGGGGTKTGGSGIRRDIRDPREFSGPLPPPPRIEIDTSRQREREKKAGAEGIRSERDPRDRSFRSNEVALRTSRFPPFERNFRAERGDLARRFGASTPPTHPLGSSASSLLPPSPGLLGDLLRETLEPWSEFRSVLRPASRFFSIAPVVLPARFRSFDAHLAPLRCESETSPPKRHRGVDGGGNRPRYLAPFRKGTMRVVFTEDHPLISFLAYLLAFFGKNPTPPVRTETRGEDLPRRDERRGKRNKKKDRPPDEFSRVWTRPVGDRVKEKKVPVSEGFWGS